MRHSCIVMSVGLKQAYKIKERFVSTLVLELINRVICLILNYFGATNTTNLLGCAKDQSPKPPEL